MDQKCLKQITCTTKELALANDVHILREKLLQFVHKDSKYDGTRIIPMFNEHLWELRGALFNLSISLNIIREYIDKCINEDNPNG